MGIPFNMGDPVQVIANPNRVGKVVGLIEPTFDCFGVPIRLAQVVVQPPLKTYTSSVYFVKELILCRCAVRTNQCESLVPF